MSAAIKQTRVHGELESSQANGMTPLMHAVCDDSVDAVDAVRALLDCGVDVNEKRNDGFTALSLAAFFGHTRIVELLLERGADVRAVTRFGTSPEIWAKARGFREVVDLLQAVSKTANTSHEDSALPENGVVVTAAPKTLPEIHDPPLLIGAAFHPGRAFIARVSSDRRSLAALSVALVVTLGLAIVASYQMMNLLRDDVKKTAFTDNNVTVQSEAVVAQPVESESRSQESAPQQPHSDQSVAVEAQNEVAPAPSQETTTAPTMVRPSIKILPMPRLSHSSVSRVKRDPVTRSEQPKQITHPESEIKPAPLTVEVSPDRTSLPPQTRAADPPPVQPAPLGITSSKPRTKVIQWP